MTENDTPLTPVVDALERADVGKSNMGTTTETLIERGAVTFPLELFQREFIVLAWPKYDYKSDHRGVSTVLYPDMESIAEGEDVADTDYIAAKHIHPGSVTGDADGDIEHLLATCLGYLVRYLLDGQKFRWGGSVKYEAKLGTKVSPHGSTEAD